VLTRSGAIARVVDYDIVTPYAIMRDATVLCAPVAAMFILTSAHMSAPRAYASHARGAQHVHKRYGYAGVLLLARRRVLRRAARWRRARVYALLLAYAQTRRYDALSAQEARVACHFDTRDAPCCRRCRHAAATLPPRRYRFAIYMLMRQRGAAA